MRASVRQGLGILVTAAASFVASCDGLGITRGCTLIGCEDGLRVHLVGAVPVPTPLTVTVTAPGGAPQTVQCTATGYCAEYVFFHGFMPESVTVEVHAGGVYVTGTYRPVYHNYQPNGPHCDPTCRQATVEIPVG